MCNELFVRLLRCVVLCCVVVDGGCWIASGGIDHSIIELKRNKSKLREGKGNKDKKGKESESDLQNETKHKKGKGSERKVRDSFVGCIIRAFDTELARVCGKQSRDQ